MPEKKSCNRGDLILSSPAVALNAHAASNHVGFVISVPRTTKLCPVDGVATVKVAPGLVAKPATTSSARPIVFFLSYSAGNRFRIDGAPSKAIISSADCRG